jgi:hypothetical protein
LLGDTNGDYYYKITVVRVVQLVQEVTIRLGLLKRCY